jgi:MoxR-like ATPase
MEEKPAGDLTSRDAVFDAIREFNDVGRDAFLGKYGFGRAKSWHLIYEGKPYDSKAIYGVAYGIEHPDRGHLVSADFTGGEHSVARRLEKLGFEVENSSVGRESAQAGGTPSAGRLFVFTAANPEAREHLDKTLRGGIEISTLAGLEDVMPTLEEHARDGLVHMWGARPGPAAERRWERLEPGDVGLVYSDSHFVLSCRVYAKARSAAIAKAVWGEDGDGATWECMSFLDPVEEINVSLADVVHALGYKASYVPQGFEIPNEEIQERIRRDYGSADAFIRALVAGERPRRVWWVNQNQTFAEEREGGHLWAPKRNSAGRTQAHWDSLSHARPGDLVLSYAGQHVRAVSSITAVAQDSRRPSDQGFEAWEQDGRRLPVTFRDLERTIPLSDIPAEWRIEDGGPFDRNGGVKQGYLFPLSERFVARLDERFPELDLGSSMTTMPDRLTIDVLRETAEAPPFNLQLDDGIYAALVAALASGKHVVLTGPPGTAKTTLAQAASKAATSLGMCDGYLLTTATADWTTYETIGGLHPTADNNLEFREGHFLDAISAQQWLVIDELNRSQFDRAFGQLFTVLSGQPVTLPYTRPGERSPLTLWPPGEPAPESDEAVLRIPPEWRIIATMNVFDKNLLFEMSYALMRRFAFIEVPSPARLVFQGLIDEWSEGDREAAETAKALMALRDLRDIGPAVYRDITAFASERRSVGPIEEGALRLQAFYSYLLPQFEGLDEVEGKELFKAVLQLVGGKHRAHVHRMLTDVLGLTGLKRTSPPVGEEPDPPASEDETLASDAVAEVEPEE